MINKMKTKRKAVRIENETKFKTDRTIVRIESKTKLEDWARCYEHILCMI